MDFSIPWHSFFGGMLLGLSALLLLLFCGKIAGISGIISGLLTPQKGDIHWRSFFLLGMIFSVFIVAPFGFSLPELAKTSLLQIVIAGFLVGFGTQLGNGCTSGHGIIGIGRFSKRSMVATLTFMAFAVLVVFIRRLLGDI